MGFNLGLDHDEDTLFPMLSYNGNKDIQVRNISCGGNHTIMLLSDGSMLGCGDNSSGQLADVKEHNRLVGWKKLQTPGKVVACTACWESTIIVTEDGRVYSRGTGLKGELGLGESLLESRDEFQLVLQISSFENPRLFSSFQNCILVVDKPDRSGSIVYGWGNNTKCQLTEPKSRRISLPNIIYEEDNMVSEVSMGKDFLIIVDSNGTIIKYKGNIPEDFISNYEECWKSQQGLTIKSMWKSVHIGTKKDMNKLYSYGNNIHGQLFPGIGTTGIKNIEMFTTGSEHGILLAEVSNEKRKTVFCWGWGEHGNCGSLNSDKSVSNWVNDKANVSSPLNPVITLKDNDVHTYIQLFGGCASSWIVTNTPIL